LKLRAGTRVIHRITLHAMAQCGFAPFDGRFVTSRGLKIFFTLIWLNLP
jgi:hypothetical protein